MLGESSKSRRSSICVTHDLVAPSVSGIWIKDCAAGRKLALLTTRRIQEIGNPMLLDRAMKIVELDDGIRAGFISTMAELAVRGIGK